MIRRGFSILAILSLLIWIALIALWFRSRSSTDAIYKTVQGVAISVTSTSNRGLWLQWTKGIDENISRPLQWAANDVGRNVHTVARAYGDPSSMDVFQHAGILVRRGTVYQVDSERTELFARPTMATTRSLITMVNLTWPALLLYPLILPILRLALIWRDRRHVRKCYARNICPRCHYDLRASKGRCPECGTRIPERKEGELRQQEELGEELKPQP